MFAKILLTVTVVALIWFGFRYLSRMAELREKRPQARAVPGQAPSGAAGGNAAGEVQDLVPCRVCGTWQPGRSARSCGRPDCPY